MQIPVDTPNERQFLLHSPSQYLAGLPNNPNSQPFLVGMPATDIATLPRNQDIPRLADKTAVLQSRLPLHPQCAPCGRAYTCAVALRTNMRSDITSAQTVVSHSLAKLSIKPPHT